jgi:ABC-type uncharacterized transport system involved in gliding motility auxiliary subunit
MIIKDITASEYSNNKKSNYLQVIKSCTMCVFQVILSPRQPNLSPLQVEILEKDLAELRIDLKEERDKNQQLYGIVQEQQR